MLLNDVSVAATVRLVTARLSGDAEFSFLAIDFQRQITSPVRSARAFKPFRLSPVALARRLVALLRAALAAAAG
jgi:hypothetical protein